MLDEVGVAVLDEAGVAVLAAVVVEALDEVGELVDVGVLVAVGVLVGVALVVPVDVGDEVEVGDEVGVGDEVDLAGVPELQVTELPSAERTHTICDPLPPVGLGARPGTAEPDPGTTVEVGGNGEIDIRGPGVGAVTPPSEGALDQEIAPVPGDDPEFSEPNETDPCDPDAPVRAALAMACTASARPTPLIAARRGRDPTTWAALVAGGVSGAAVAAGLVGELAEAAGASASVGPIARVIASTNALMTLVTRGNRRNNGRAGRTIAPARSGPDATRAPRTTPMQRPQD